MTEKQPQGSGEQFVAPKSPEARPEAPKSSAEKQSPLSGETKRQSAAELKNKVEALAVSGAEMGTTEQNKKPSQNSRYIDKSSRDKAMNETLATVRTQLSRPKRALSKVVHGSITGEASDIAAKTVARPTSLLVGGFLALIASTVLVIASKRYGFDYNAVVIGVVFVAGYAVGLLVDLLKPKRGRQ